MWEDHVYRKSLRQSAKEQTSNAITATGVKKKIQVNYFLTSY